MACSFAACPLNIVLAQFFALFPMDFLRKREAACSFQFLAKSMMFADELAGCYFCAIAYQSSKTKHRSKLVSPSGILPDY